MKVYVLKSDIILLDFSRVCAIFGRNIKFILMKKSFSFIFLIFILITPLCAQRSERVVVAVSQESGVTISMKGNILQLQNATVGEKLEILSIVGVRVFQKKIESTNQEFELDLPKGYYIVKIGTVVRKISVK
jgi:hypothetical protein